MRLLQAIKFHTCQKPRKCRYLFFHSLYKEICRSNHSKSSEEKFDILNIKSIQADTLLKPNNIFYLQTIGSGSHGAPKSLYVFSPIHKFLFNCGEGTRRIANEFKRSIGSVSALFVTSRSWENISGIPCLQEYMEHNSGHTFQVYGPEGLESLMKHFSQIDSDLPYIKYINPQNDKVEFEGCLKVKMVPIFGSHSLPGRERTKEFWFAENNGIRYKRDHVIAYICQVPSSEGTVCSDLMVRAGVPPGPLARGLRSGDSVTLPNGKVITPRDVSSGVFDGSSFIVIDIPSVNYLDSLLECTAFSPHQVGPQRRDEDLPEVIVHFSPPHVMKDPRYRQWVETFSPSVSHIVLNERNVCTGLAEPVKLQFQLNRFLPEVFPLLHDTSCLFSPSLQKEEMQDHEELIHPLSLTKEYQFSGATVQSRSLLQYRIRPSSGFDSSSCPILDPQKIVQSCIGDEGARDLFQIMRLQVEEVKSRLLEGKREYPNVLFLGTGSACPSNIRNVSGILVNTEPDKCLLLDCGAGTFIQLVRFMGLQKAHSVLRKMQLAYVSHHHRDHHMGLISLLLERQKAFQEVEKPLPLLYLLTPSPVYQYLKKVNNCFAPILKNVILLNNAKLLEKAKFYDREVLKEIQDFLSLRSLSITFVRHVRNSFGISIAHQNGWKVTYSGDTMPSVDLVEIGLDSDLLIHEASFESEMADAAYFKRHSTISQAINIGQKMRAKYTLLTHFSQRYLQIPMMEEEYPANVGFAFDNMEVTLDDLPLLAFLYPSLKELFYSHLDKLKSRNMRKKFL